MSKSMMVIDGETYWHIQYVELCEKDLAESRAEVERLNYLAVSIGKRFDKEREHVKTLQKRLGRDNYGTPPAKPVVWVKKTETESRYGVCAVKCNEDGDKFYWDETCDIPLRAWQDIYKDIREVRVWTETCETCGQAIESEGR